MHSKYWKALEVIELPLIYSIILTALYLCAPGFLPKEIKYYLFGLFTTSRGHGFLFFLAAAIPVLLSAIRIRGLGYTSTVTGGCFFLLSGVMLLQFVLDHLLGAYATAWFLRGLFFYGLYFGRRSWPVFLKSYKDRLAFIRKSPWHAKILFWLCLFFLARQTFAYFYNRGIPFQDEIHFWHTAAMDFTKNGFNLAIERHNYTLAVPWLAALPATLFGSQNAESVFAYSCFVFFGMVFLSLELSKNMRAILAGLGILLLCFTIQKDLFALLAASLYGEGIAALLCAVLMAEFLKLWPDKNPNIRALIGFFGIVAYATVSKPPLANLAWGFPVIFLFKNMNWHKRSLAFLSAILYLPWYLRLSLLNKGTY